MSLRVSHGLAGLAVFALPLMAQAGTYDLSVDRVTIDTGDFRKTGMGYNGSLPGPVLRFKEGEDVTINVTNNLSEPTSVHWHGLILSYQQDGVPGISFNGIAPGEIRAHVHAAAGQTVGRDAKGSRGPTAPQPSRPADDEAD